MKFKKFFDHGISSEASNQEIRMGFALAIVFGMEEKRQELEEWKFKNKQQRVGRIFFWDQREGENFSFF